MVSWVAAILGIQSLVESGVLGEQNINSSAISDK
jgi:hypothetical protein